MIITVLKMTQKAICVIQCDTHVRIKNILCCSTSARFTHVGVNIEFIYRLNVN